MTKPIARRNLSRFVRQKYEHQEVALINQYLPPEKPVLELGGGLGFVTVYAGRKLEPKTDIEVVEANPELIPLIRETLELNDIQATVRHVAYNPNGEESRLRVSEDYVASSTVQDGTSSNTISVPGCSLTTLINNNSADSVTLIIDIEGAEFELLDSPDERERMSRRCPLVIVEIHQFAGNVENAVKRFADLGYTHVAAEGNVHVFEQQDRE